MTNVVTHQEANTNVSSIWCSTGHSYSKDIHESMILHFVFIFFTILLRPKLTRVWRECIMSSVNTYATFDETNVAPNFIVPMKENHPLCHHLSQISSLWHHLSQISSLCHHLSQISSLCHHIGGLVHVNPCYLFYCAGRHCKQLKLVEV